MQDKPRVGLVLMRSSETCCEDTGEVLGAIQTDEDSIVARLSQHFDITGPWIVDSVDARETCQNALREATVDMVLLAYQTRAEESLLEALVESIGNRPFVVWCYLPWRRLPRPTSYGELQRTTGLVGTFAALGALRNMGAAYLFTFGAPDDPRLMQDLVVAGRAARLRRQLRQMRIGVLPSPHGPSNVTYVDERRLAAELGPVVEHLPVELYRQAAGAVTPGEVSAYLTELRGRFPIGGVGEDTLARAGRAALGLARLAGQANVDVLALNTNEEDLVRLFNMRPALYPDLQGASGVLYQPEADLGAAMANYILNQLTGSPTMFLEFYFWDEALNQLVGGHGGLQNPANADPHEVLVARDYGCCLANIDDGAEIQFLARAGRVTLLQLRSTPVGWRAMALSGVCLEGQPWLEGLPHAILRLDATVAHFLNRVSDVGVTQHWIMAYGSVLDEIAMFCRMEGIPMQIMSYSS